VGLLNPGGPIAQFQRRNCSILPVEVISLSGVRSFKHRAKRATNSNLPMWEEVSLEQQFARLRAVGQVMQEK